MTDGLRPVAEPEVVLAYLRGELESDFDLKRAHVREALDRFGGLRLVHDPDLNSDAENRARDGALGRVNGWRTGGKFTGFPENVDWSHGVLPADALPRVRFTPYPYWEALSGGSRRPADVRPTLLSGSIPEWLSELGTNWCFEYADTLATAEAVGDLILIGTPDLADLVVLDGHRRLTAVFVGGWQDRIPVRAYVGLSPAIRRCYSF